MTEVVSFAIKKELREQIDFLRGDIPRSKFICIILEKAIKKEVPGHEASPDIIVTSCPSNCNDCTGLYINDILSSKIICACSCHRKEKRG
jgi:hypothetical protein